MKEFINMKWKPKLFKVSLIVDWCQKFIWLKVSWNKLFTILPRPLNLSLLHFHASNNKKNIWLLKIFDVCIFIQRKKDISGNMNKAKQLLGKWHMNFLDEKCQCSSTVCCSLQTCFYFFWMLWLAFFVYKRSDRRWLSSLIQIHLVTGRQLLYFQFHFEDYYLSRLSRLCLFLSGTYILYICRALD